MGVKVDHWESPVTEKGLTLMMCGPRHRITVAYFCKDGSLKAEHRHLRDLVRAWADGRTAPLPLPAGVTAEAITDCLLEHNAEAALGFLLPAPAHQEAFVQQVNFSRSRTDFLLLEYERLLPILTAARRRRCLRMPRGGRVSPPRGQKRPSFL